MRRWLKDRYHRRVIRRVRARHSMVRAVPEQGLFNFRCHENSVEYLRTHPGRRLDIVEVMVVDDDTPILHWMVHDLDQGVYLEVTLGWRAEQMEYYPLRTVHPSDHRATGREFNRAVKDWTEEFVPWWARFFLRIDRVV